MGLVFNMVDNINRPLKSVQQNLDQTTERLQKLEDSSAKISASSRNIALAGAGIVTAVLDPVKSTFATQKALGELSSLGVQDLKALETAATDFSNTFAGTSKAEFIAASYDIKSGIASLSDAGVAEYTKLSALTAKATKSNVAEMTSLFATGYGIYKGMYAKMSDLEFGQMFSAGISTAVKQFKTTGSGMAEAIESLGAAATTAKVPLQEQLSILGMLQATMSGGEAGTKYAAFIGSAAKAGSELGLKFTDANNQLKSMPEILSLLKSKYGETLDAMEKQELAKAFGTDEAVDMIDLFYNKTGDLTNNINTMSGALHGGTKAATEMAGAMNKDPAAKWELANQKLQNLKETVGVQLLPTIISLIDQFSAGLTATMTWVNANQSLVTTFLLLALKIGVIMTVVGGSISLVSGFVGTLAKFSNGLFNTISILSKFSGGFKALKSGAETLQIIGLYAKDYAAVGLKALRSGVLSLFRALPGLIGSIWSFTAALLANPVTWIVVGIIALGAAIFLLWKHWDKVSAFLSGVWQNVVQGIGKGFAWLKAKVMGASNLGLALLAIFFPILGVPALLWKNWGKIVGIVKTVFAGVKGALNSGLKAVLNLFKSIGNQIGSAIKAVVNKAKSWGKNLIDGFINGIKSSAGKVKNAVLGVMGGVKKVLGFNSPAEEGPGKNIVYWGANMLLGFADGISSKAGHVKQITADALGSAFELPFINGSASILARSEKRLQENRYSSVTKRHQEKKVSLEKNNSKDGKVIIHIANLNVQAQDYQTGKDFTDMLVELVELDG